MLQLHEEIILKTTYKLPLSIRQQCYISVCAKLYTIEEIILENKHHFQCDSNVNLYVHALLCLQAVYMCMSLYPSLTLFKI